jgi:hypothetical protein
VAQPSTPAPPLLAALAAGLGLAAALSPAQAQTQTWQRQGAPPPADSTVVPENCAVASDGSITCGTRLEGGTGRPPAAPRLDPFPN